MTAILISRPGRLISSAPASTRRRSRPMPDWPLHAPQNVRTPVDIKTGPHGQITDDSAAACLPASPPGVIGGAVIRAARRSARLSQRHLARMLSVSPATVRMWETGTCPLFAVPYGQLCHLADTLRRAGACVGQDRSELIRAGQCDLLITGMLHGFEDYAELPAVDEDTDDGATARSLLRWALTGSVPDQYRPYTSTGPLLTHSDAADFASIARDLNAGSQGTDLISYGATLLALTSG